MSNNPKRNIKKIAPKELFNLEILNSKNDTIIKYFSN